MDAEIKKLCDEYLTYETHPDFLGELRELLDRNDEAAIRDRFYTQLAFGTGGLRGIIGAGYNRINPYMVRRATQGLAEYINQTNVEKPSVAIAYDSRNYSGLFAEEAALVLGHNKIKVFLFSSLRPTPELSFAVRKLDATAGIVITASHNPSSYNGYKVYWSDGAQVVPPHDVGILDRVHQVSGEVSALDLATATAEGWLEYIDSEVDESYYGMIEGYLLRSRFLGDVKPSLKVVYTPLHGAGTRSVEAVLSRMGATFLTVPEQREPDGS